MSLAVDMSWTPKVGMLIQYKPAHGSKTNRTPSPAKIVAIDGQRLQIFRESSNRHTWLEHETWRRFFEPVPDARVTQGLDQAEMREMIRQIVQDELKALFG